MNILVFALPLYQLWIDLREPLDSVRVKVAQSFHSVRQRLHGSFRAQNLHAAARDPPQSDRCDQARIAWQANSTIAIEWRSLCLLRKCWLQYPVYYPLLGGFALLNLSLMALGVLRAELRQPTAAPSEGARQRSSP
jgi:hypothetical protein